MGATAARGGARRRRSRRRLQRALPPPRRRADDESKFDRSLGRSVLIGGRLCGREGRCVGVGSVRRLAHCLCPSLPPATHTPPPRAGLLGLPQEDMHRRAKQERAGAQQQWADELRRRFDPYDWTKMLG